MSQSTRSLASVVATLLEQQTEEWIQALANPRRRHLIAELESVSYPIETGEIAAGVANRASESGEASPPTSDVHIQIHHNDLPRLEHVGLIDYSLNDGLVEGVTCHLDDPTRDILVPT